MLNLIFLFIGFLFGFTIGYLFGWLKSKKVIILAYTEQKDLESFLQKLNNGGSYV